MCEFSRIVAVMTGFQPIRNRKNSSQLSELTKPLKSGLIRGRLTLQIKAVDYKVYQMWPPFLSLKILGLGRQVNWLYRPACVGRLCHSKYKMAATSDILYKSTALPKMLNFKR